MTSDSEDRVPQRRSGVHAAVLDGQLIDVDRWVARAMSGTEAQALTAVGRAELEAHLRRLFATDPTLRDRLRALDDAADSAVES